MHHSRATERHGALPLLATRAGDIELRIPNLRKGSFFPSILEPCRWIDQALDRSRWRPSLTVSPTVPSTSSPRWCRLRVSKFEESGSLRRAPRDSRRLPHPPPRRCAPRRPRDQIKPSISPPAPNDHVGHDSQGARRGLPVELERMERQRHHGWRRLDLVQLLHQGHLQGVRCVLLPLRFELAEDHGLCEWLGDVRLGLIASDNEEGMGHFGPSPPCRVRNLVV